MPERAIEILLVEDNPNDVKLTLHSLERHKVTNHIHIARDGAEALDFLFRRGDYAARDENAPKLILLDLKLPKVDGVEVLRSKGRSRDLLHSHRCAHLFPARTLT
jgi:two-component system, response regulator